MRRKRMWLVALAFVGLIVASLAVIVGSNQRAAMLKDTGETERSVHAALERAFPQRGLTTVQPPEAVRDQREEIARGLMQEPYVSAVWLVDEAGRLRLPLGQQPGKATVLESGMHATAADGRSVRYVQDLADPVLVRTLEGGSGTGPRKLGPQDLAAVTQDAMRRPVRDHDDVYRYVSWFVNVSAADSVPATVPSGPYKGAIIHRPNRPVSLPWVAIVRYDVSPLVSKPPTLYNALMLVALAGLALYWLALPAWVCLDARDRGEPKVAWTLFVLVGNLLALLAYLIVTSRPRPQVT